MTGIDNETTPSLDAIYAFLDTDACDQAIRAQFLERWLPEDRTIFDGEEDREVYESADSFIARLAQACIVELQCYLLRQDPTLDPDADVRRLQDSVSGVPFAELTAVGIENLPPLSPPPTPEEIETRIAEERAFDEKMRVPEDIAAPMRAMMATLMGEPQPEPEQEKPQADPEAATYAGPFAAAFAPAGVAVDSQGSSEDHSYEQEDAVEGIFVDRMEADLTERFLPQVLVPMVAAAHGEAQEAAIHQSPTSGASSVKSRHLPLAQAKGTQGADQSDPIR